MMKKKLPIALGIVLLAISSVYAQDRLIQPCNTYAAMEEHFRNDPGAKKTYDLQQQALLELQNQPAPVAGKAAAAPVYTVPVVFHVLHLGGSENVTDAQCIAALDQVNKDFAKLGSDINTIAQPFQNSYVDSEIRFKLAKKDPNGNCTTGINHIYDTRTNWTQSSPSNFNGITWNPTKYLNVIVVKQIVPTGTVAGGGIIVGYTYKPGSWSSGASQDAIVYNHSYLGGLQARSLTHEIGHWLNLSHNFGNTNNPGVNCGDDGIADTPPTKGNYGACPSSASGNGCAVSSTTAYAAGQDNVHNFMDYSNCPKNFTTGQSNAMRSTLTSFVSNRVNLSQTANLIATGVDDTSPCAPIADFYSTSGGYTVCSGGTINFKDFSFNGTVTNYNWTASNGAFAVTSNSPVTDIVFPTMGLTTVSLVVSNSQGSSQKVRVVNVLDGTPGITGPFVEGFEGPGTPGGWMVTNKNAGSGTWDQTFNAAYDGGASFWIEGSKSGGNHEDILESPVIDINSVEDPKLEFALSYARKSTNHNDNLKLLATKDCGSNWIELVSLSSHQMQQGTGGVTSTPYIPPTHDAWKIIKVTDYPNWTNFVDAPSVTFRFVFTEDANGFGNNLYIDAINLAPASNTTGISEFDRTHKLSLYPNPSTGAALLSFETKEPAIISVQMINALGQDVLPASRVKFNAGSNSILVNPQQTLPAGIYFVNLDINGEKTTKRLVIR